MTAQDIEYFEDYFQRATKERYMLAGSYVQAAIRQTDKMFAEAHGGQDIIHADPDLYEEYTKQVGECLQLMTAPRDLQEAVVKCLKDYLRKL